MYNPEQSTSPEEDSPPLTESIKEELQSADVDIEISDQKITRPQEGLSPADERFVISFPKPASRKLQAAVDKAILDHYSRDSQLQITEDEPTQAKPTRRFTFRYQSQSGQEVRMRVERILSSDNKRITVTTQYEE